MTDLKLEQKFKIIIFVELFTAFAFTLFWVGYWVGPGFFETLPAFYSLYPDSTPFPDLILVFLLIVSAWQTVNQQKGFKGLIMVNALIMAYLGVLGVDFLWGDSIRLISMPSMLKKGYVNLWLIVFGLYFLLKVKNSKSTRKENSKTQSN